jgi:hypothetical protein
MQADYSLELAAEDPALELPWCSDDGLTGYVNLKLHPDLLASISEAANYPELGAFLGRMNAPGFPLETAKCDAWFESELAPEEDVFGADCKFVSYIDLLFSDDSRRFSLPAHERLAEDVSNLMKRAPEMPAAAEFIVRHCHCHADGVESDSRIGFCITAYVTGYGDSEEEARLRWAIALKLVQNALVQAEATKTTSQE